MTDLQPMLAQMNRTAAAALAKAARELGDRATWRPLDKGRSALDQVIECAGFNLLGARVFTEHAMPPLDPAAFEQLGRENDTLEKALALLETGTDRLARAIEAFPSEKLDDKLTLPFGGGMEKSFGEIALMSFWNTTYHEGQINYIQTLCAAPGDGAS
jgi:uncharacterized damage-inducible protein DinB